MTKKPSKRMLHVLERLANGWELGRSGGWGAGAWMQEGKIGYGGKHEDVLQGTFFALYHRGWLKKLSRSESRYTISEAGRAALAGGGAPSP